MLLLLEPVPPFLPDFVLTSTMAKTAYGIYTHAYPSVWEFKVITQEFHYFPGWQTGLFMALMSS